MAELGKRGVLAFLLTLFAGACGSDDGHSSSPNVPPPVELPNETPTPTLTCPAYAGDHAFPELAPFDMATAVSIGAIDGVPSVSPTGSARYSFSLALPPARWAPHLEIVYDSHAPRGILGKGFALTGTSAIHRCGSNLAQDGQIRGVQLDPHDHYCLNGSPLVQIDEGQDAIGVFAEYRTAIDSHTKILGYGAPTAGGFAPTYFVAYLPNGNIVQYGKSINARVRWRGGVTRSWSKELEMDRRGNTIRYAYFTDNGDAKDTTTREQVIEKIRYTGFIDENGVETPGNASVEFHYDDDNRYGKLFYEGEEVTRRMRLVRIDMRTNGGIVRSYPFTFDEDSVTNEALLVRLDECAKGDAAQCKPATFFDWKKAGAKGFASHSTKVPVPVKGEDERFSWTVSDITGDGGVDLVTATTDPDTGMNRWFVYENDGSGNFGTPVEWASFAFPQGFTKQWRITPLDENGDGRIDLLIDQPDGTAWNTYRVLRSMASPSPHFELVATEIPRVSQFRASEFTVDSHAGLAIADINADGMNDVITCGDLRTWYGKAEYVPYDCDPDEACEPSLARWSAHLWRPTGGPGGTPGFEKTERHIEALDGVSCWTMNRFFGAVDWDADGQTNLVTAGKDGRFWTHQLEVPSLKWESKSLSMALPNVLYVNVENDPVANMVVYPLTHGRAKQMEGEWDGLRTLFPDVNGDGYPDVLFTGPHGTAIKPFVVVNEGRDEYTGFLSPYDAIDGNLDAFYYSPFARVFDANGDRRDDFVIPVAGGCQTTDAYACYVVFESASIGKPAKVIPMEIPFEQPDGYTVAPQYLLRTADVNSDGLTDMVHPTVSDQMVVYENQAAQNLLTSVTTGRNPLDAGDAGFRPDVTFEYGNLVDKTSRTPAWEHEALTYIARADATNTCVYPRACVVGGPHVVTSYTLNNGRNQARQFSMHYRDERAHRHGRGLLGFAEVETRDLDTGVASRQRFDNVTFDPTFKTFPFAGIPAETRTMTPLATTTLETAMITAHEVIPTNAGKTYFVATLSTEKVRKEGADVLERSWTLVDDVDEYGNVLQWRSGSDGVDVLKTSSRIVKNDSTSWLIGFVEQESGCSMALGETQCRKSTMKHNARGEVFRIDRAPNDTTAHLVTYLIRDQYGNTTNVIAEDDFGNHREACVTYEPTGTFLWAARNGVGHTSYRWYHHGLGVLQSVRDANGLVTKWRHDNFGRTVEEHAPDGLVTTFAAARVKNGAWTTRVTESTPGHGARETVFDSFERPVESRVRGPDVDTVGISAFGKSVWIVQDKRYDFLGRLEWQSISRIEGDVIAEMKGATFEYDNANRLTKTVTPWGAPIARTYDHDVVTTIEPGPSGIPAIATSVKHDALGRAIEVMDAKQGITRHVYGPYQELRRVELPDGTIRETKQDEYGRVVFEDDPDRGKTILEHNGFDEVIKLHDAAGRHYAFEHDAVGRLVQRSEGLNVSTYEFDTALHGVGLVARTTAADGHIEEFAYDTLSRPKATTLQLADGRTFEQSRTYDQFGRIKQITYPNAFSVIRQYDSTGTLVEIHNGATRDTVWTLDVVNAAGQTMFETFGNGVQTERVYSDEAGYWKRSSRWPARRRCKACATITMHSSTWRIVSIHGKARSSDSVTMP